MSELAFSPIPSSELGGAIALNVFALLSTIALVSVILRVSWLAIQRCRNVYEVRECVFFNTQLGRYAACLIIAMIFNAVAGIIGLRWTTNRGITEGWVCRSQATAMQIGNFGTGYFTTAIAVHTFNSLVLKMRQSVIICRTSIGVGWVLSLSIALIPLMIHLPQGQVYGAVGLSCSVRDIYPKLQFALHLLPILLASIFGAILYSLIFLVLRGTLKYNKGIKLTLNPHERWNDSKGLAENYHRFIARVARSMLWYPVAYVTFLIPYAVTRLFMISGFTVPFEAIVFAYVCYFSLSIVDVLLLYNTFRVLGPAFDARSSASTRRTESFGTSGNLEKYAPSPTSSQRAEMEERIQHYRAQSLGSLDSSSGNSFSASSGKSTQQLLPLYLGSGVADHRHSGQSNPSMLGRFITPSSTYSQWDMVTPAPAAMVAHSPSRDVAAHIRNDSFSSRGLPAPPRRTRSPVTSQPMPEIQLSRQLTDEAYTDRWLSHQRSTQTFGHQESPPTKSPSLWSEEASGSEWSSRIQRQSPQGYGQPTLSAVAPSFPNQVYPRSPPHSATVERSNSAYSSSPLSSPGSPSHRHRPMFLARGSTPDMRASREVSSRYS